MGMIMYPCGCSIATSMYGTHPVMSVGHCWQHWGALYDQDKSNKQMAQEMKEYMTANPPEFKQQDYSALLMPGEGQK